MTDTDPGAMSYARYLQLDRLLAAQDPQSAAHDELLFIVIHQSTELWMKLCRHELDAARQTIAGDALRPAFKMLSRVARIQTQMVQSWDVLATMTPVDYAEVRPFLGPSSGFQSWQYRMIEFMLGERDPRMVDVHRGSHAEALAAEMRRPSLYDVTLQLLALRGFAVTPRTDFAAPYATSSEVEAAWASIYRAPDTHWDLYELAEKLVDLDYHFQRWRFGHLKTVERIIGLKRGTGGSEGVGYLEGVLAKRFFPELITVRTAL